MVPEMFAMLQAPLSAALTVGVAAKAGNVPDMAKEVFEMAPIVLAPAGKLGIDATATGAGVPPVAP
jgi:hypothetical protein